MSAIEVEENENGSALAVAARDRAAFVARHSKTCACPWELREEGGSLECAKCGAPVVLRRTA